MNWLASRLELSRGDAANLRAMEGLRGFAVFLVFLVHFTMLVTPWVPERSALATLYANIRTIGYCGVDLFFVLSGYLIYGSLISRASRYGTFMRRRIQRLYPPFIAVFALYVALSLLVPEESKIPQGAWPAAAYLAANFLLLPGIFPIRPMITVTWSLSYEMLYYLLTPLVITAGRLRARSAPTRIAFFLTIAFLLVAYCAAWGGPVRLSGFIGGIILFEALHYGLWRTPGSRLGVAGAVTGLAVMLIPTTATAALPVQIALLNVGLWALCCACLGRPASTVARFFSWTPVRWLGNMSYSYYLVHGVTALGFFRLVARIWPPAHQSARLSVLLLPVTFAVTLIPSAALFLLIERRFSLTRAPRRQADPRGVTAPITAG